MKRLMIAAVAGIALFAATDAKAAVVHYRSNYQTPVYTNSGYSNYNYGYRSSRRQGPFGRLMEMERRKNAMLRQMFWGY